MRTAIDITVTVVPPPLEAIRTDSLELDVVEAFYQNDFQLEFYFPSKKFISLLCLYLVSIISFNKLVCV